MVSLDATRHAVSPRYSPGPTPWPSLAIHGGVLVFWLALFIRAFGPIGPLTWAAGFAYVGYDTVLLLFTFSQTLVLTRQPVKHGVFTPPSVAVLVAAHNEAEVLPATLHALLRQSSPAEQILIVDDGSTDQTAIALAGFGLSEPDFDETSVQGKLHWLRLPHGGKAKALNRALEIVDAELVMTVDADTLLDTDALLEMQRRFADDSHLVAATGILAPACEPTWQGRCLEWFQAHEYLRNFLSRFAWMQQDGLLLISGAFAAFRRSAVLAVGGFDARCLVEDYELIHRLRRFSALRHLGWTTAVVGRSRARTDAPSTIGAFLRQRRRWFGGFLQTQFWYRDMVGNRVFGHVGTRMLPIKAIDTFQPIFGLTAFAILIVYLIRGRLNVVLPAGGVMLAKVVLDLSFYVWSVYLYRRWVGTSGKVHFRTAFIAAVIEPVSFQLLRHLGATLGWFSFLTGNLAWGKRARGSALLTDLPEPTPPHEPRRV